MTRITGSAVGVEIVDGITLVFPCVRQIGARFWGDHRWQHTVIVDVIPVIAGLACDNDAGEPLDTSAPDLSWNDDPQWFAMVRVKQLAVHPVGNHDAAFRVHCPAE